MGRRRGEREEEGSERRRQEGVEGEGKEKVERKMKSASRRRGEKIRLMVHSALSSSRQRVPDSVAPACCRREHLSQMRHHEYP